MGWGDSYNQSKESLAALSSQAVNMGMQKKQLDMQQQQWEGQKDANEKGNTWDMIFKIVGTGIGILGLFL